MTWVMSYCGHQETALETPPDTTAQKFHDAAQNLDAKLRRMSTGWGFLAALEYFDLNIGELPGRLRVAAQSLEPRFAHRTLTVKEGPWFDDLVLAQRDVSRIDSVAKVHRSLFPEAKQLLSLCAKLRESGKALPVEQGVPLDNAVNALHGFVASEPLKGYIGRLEGNLEHERGLVSLGAVEDRSAEMESKLVSARAVLAALQG